MKTLSIIFLNKGIREAVQRALKRSPPHHLITWKFSAFRQTTMVFDEILVKTKGKEMNELPILFTANQVAKIMGISRSQVYVLMNNGHLGSVHIGRSRRITRAQVDSFIADLSPAA